MMGNNPYPSADELCREIDVGREVGRIMGVNRRLAVIIEIAMYGVAGLDQSAPCMAPGLEWSDISDQLRMMLPDMDAVAMRNLQSDLQGRLL